jgi:glycosyltransferase involved in cell wall biosynthesis
VLHLIDSFREGGSERQAVQLVRLLQATGLYRVHLACLDGSGALRDEVAHLTSLCIQEYPLTSFHDPNAVIQACRFVRHLRKHQIDLVHTHDFYTNVFGITAAALARVPVRIASRRESAKRTEAQRRVERGAFRCADAVIANCEEVRRQLCAEGISAERVLTIHNGLDMQRVSLPPDWCREKALAALNLPREHGLRFITILANIRAVKDHPTFLRAAQRIRARAPKAVFVIAGDGDLTQSIRALSIQLGLAGATFFIGRCDRVSDLLAVSDVGVLSSRSEGFSNAILEYMAAARPVVATDVGGAREAVVEGVTGYLVPAGDDEAMATRVLSLLENREQAQSMGAKGRRVVEQGFSRKVQLARAQALYDRLLQWGGSPSTGHPELRSSTSSTEAVLRVDQKR